MYAIEVNDMKKSYQDVHAVNGISFHVEQGELFGFLGINGAGKSTTINMLCTLFPPTSGSARVCGYELGKEDDAIRKQIGIVYQRDCLDELLSVKDNLLIRGSMYINNKKKLQEQLLHVTKILDLKDLLNRPFGKLSGGQKRRCEIARALMHAPKILFLDEPTTGLDPATRKVVWDCIDTLRRESDMSVFLTTHYMEEAAKANHIAVIDQGVLKEFGTPFELKNKYAKDQLIAYPLEEEKLQEYLNEHKYSYARCDHVFTIPMKDTKSAIPLLKNIESFLEGFEMIQGNMDDVFLNITGRALEKGV
ncbi:MAG: ABC transporter ATP-binding protein [Longicatena sp.]